MIDLVAFDLDGTVLDPQSRLTDTAAATIADLVLRGITAVSISGRSIRRTLEAFEGHSQLVSGLYLAGYNGSVIVGPDAGSGRPVMHEDRLDADIFVELARYAHGANLNLVCAQFERIDGEVVEEYRHAQPVDGLEAFGGPGFVLDPDLYSRCLVGDYKPPPMAIMVVDPDERPGHIADLEALGGAQVNVSWALPDRVQVMRRGVDKGRALMMLAQQMGVPLERFWPLATPTTIFLCCARPASACLWATPKSRSGRPYRARACALGRRWPRTALPPWCENTR